MQVDPHLARYIAELKMRDGASMKGAKPSHQRQAAAAPSGDAHSEQQLQAQPAGAAARRAVEPLPVPRLTYVKGVLHNELPSPLPSPRSTAAGALPVHHSIASTKNLYMRSL